MSGIQSPGMFLNPLGPQPSGANRDMKYQGREYDQLQNQNKEAQNAAKKPDMSPAIFIKPPIIKNRGPKVM